MKVTLLKLSHRFAYAALISTLVWNVAVLPVGLQNSPAAAMLIRIFDFPIAAGGRLLPCEHRGLDMFPDGCPPPQQEGFLFRTVRLGVPIYLLLFYLPDLIRGGRSWLRRRRDATGSRMATAKH